MRLSRNVQDVELGALAEKIEAYGAAGIDCAPIAATSMPGYALRRR
jgi:hypothetical protein